MSEIVFKQGTKKQLIGDINLLTKCHDWERTVVGSFGDERNTAARWNSAQSADVFGVLRYQLPRGLLRTACGRVSR